MKPGDSITGEELIKHHAVAVLKRKNGVLADAARTLGIDRKTLYRWLKAWGMIKGYYPADTHTPPPPAAPRDRGPKPNPNLILPDGPPTML